MGGGGETKALFRPPPSFVIKSNVPDVLPTFDFYVGTAKRTTKTDPWKEDMKSVRSGESQREKRREDKKNPPVPNLSIGSLRSNNSELEKSAVQCSVRT